jgi:hypothetical protein
MALEASVSIILANNPSKNLNFAIFWVWKMVGVCTNALFL